eukprot:NODE_16680_length_983_cov_4.578271.p1 GENE.NODE_16680_length_983_cov_4.578271~~NODE_16680_length_983_cov_4.578271.p1  ORF type:complete len:239 (+),score=86.84 NODE_16680_length_983_cov_4.578271:51-719(+)
MAYVAARRLLAEGARGCTVLELGCGTGLVSIAALMAGAAFVLATDRARPNVESAVRSARLNGHLLHGEIFDVMLPAPLPSSSSRLCGNMRSPSYVPRCANLLPRAFDFVVFSDVLYWPSEARGFGRRAAEAFAAGSTVIVADPGRRRDDFIQALREELDNLGVSIPPPLDLMPVTVPEHVLEWVSNEVRTASQLFCEEPFELVLRPTARALSPLPVTFEIVD